MREPDAFAAARLLKLAPGLPDEKVKPVVHVLPPFSRMT
jgi:hypothetical protein